MNIQNKSQILNVSEKLKVESD